ncbi:MAG: hypothetical protein Q4B54_07995, partial [Coriobacteriales bacterium]|nr:hypothetical protein [Coriobacteriales bacterium]
MTKDEPTESVDEASLEPEGPHVTVDFNPAGSYTLSFGASDCIAIPSEEDAQQAEADAQAKNDEAAKEDSAKDAASQAAADAQAKSDEATKAVADAEDKSDVATKALEAAEQRLEDAQKALESASGDEQEAANQVLMAAQEDVEEARSALENANKELEEAKSTAESAAKASEDSQKQAAEKEAATTDSASGETNKSLDALKEATAQDLVIFYPFIANRDKVEADTNYETMPEIEVRNATVGEVKAEGDGLSVSFTDPDARANATEQYAIVLPNYNAYVEVYVNFPQNMLSSETESLSSADETHELVIKVTDGAFASEVKPESITLGGSLEGLSVTSAEVSGDTLKLQVSGKPKGSDDGTNLYEEALITLDKPAFAAANGERSVVVPVRTPSAVIDQESVSIKDDGTATVSMELGSMDAGEIKASDMSFNGAEVKDFSAKGDDRLDVTLSLQGAKNAEEAADVLSGLEYQVGGAKEVAIVTDPTLWSAVSGVEFQGDNIKATFELYVEYGKFADSLAADKIKLSTEGAKAESITKTDDQTAQLVITLPANSMTKDDYVILEVVTLPAGMLLTESGAPADEVFELLADVDENTAGSSEEQANAGAAAGIVSFLPLPATGEGDANANNNANNNNNAGADANNNNNNNHNFGHTTVRPTTRITTTATRPPTTTMKPSYRKIRVKEVTLGEV